MKPITPTDMEHLSFWCREYQGHGPIPISPDKRFAVGVYQIAQAMKYCWDNPAAWQSYCAAAMHFIMSGHGHGVDVAAELPDHLPELGTVVPKTEWDNFLFAVAHAQQQIVYAMHESGKTTRASRYDPLILRGRLARLVKICFAQVPPDYVEQGCFDEMHILCMDLVNIPKPPPFTIHLESK